MRRLLLLALPLLLLGGVRTEAAIAKGAGQMAAPAGVMVPGSPYRYTTFSPRTADGVTVVARINRDGGRVGRWWTLPGGYRVPAVAYDLSGGGLSADGSTLVLSRFSRTYPPPVSRFAILDTELRLRHPWDPPDHRARHAVTRIALQGDFSFDAISPDGSTAYLIHHLPAFGGPDYIVNYEVRALDLASGRLLPQPIVDPEKPDERMEGLPITRASSPDGRWAYTLYDGNGGEPFIHALDTVGRSAACIDLPQLEAGRNLFILRMRVDRDGRRLTVMSGPPPPRELPPLSQGRPVSSSMPRPLLSVDTSSFEVSRPPAAAASSGTPWLPLGISLLVLAGGISLVAGRRRRTGPRKVPGRA